MSVYNLAEIEEKLKRFNVLILGEYLGISKKTLCKCLNCDKKCAVILRDILRDHKCPRYIVKERLTNKIVDKRLSHRNIIRFDLIGN